MKVIVKVTDRSQNQNPKNGLNGRAKNIDQVN